MVTIEHIRNLSATELRIMAYFNITGTDISITQDELAKEIYVSSKQIGVALRSLENRGLLKWNRGIGYNKYMPPSKGTITLH